MTNKIKFVLNRNHLKLIRKMYISYNGNCEFGAPEVNPKRPYGNSDVYYDIGEILGITPIGGDTDHLVFTEEQKRMMLTLHKETTTALQILVTSGAFELGLYEADEYGTNWIKV